MSKKLVISLASVAAMVAFMVTPMAAQAVIPHYFENEEMIPAAKKAHVLAWGSLTLTPEGIALAPTTCENAVGGFVENPTGGAAGVGATEDFASWNCANAACPPGEIEYPPGSSKKAEKEFIVFPGGKEYAKQSLPWPSKLTGAAAPFRTETTGVIVDLACIAHGVSEQGGALGGDSDHDTPAFLATPVVCVTEPGKAKQEPKTINGTQIGGPLTSEVEFDQPGSGKLSCVTEVEKKPVAFKGNTEGALKVFDYKEQNLIKVK